MKHEHWIRDHLCDVHFQINGTTGGWTVKTWLHFVNAFIVTEHEGPLPPTMDEVVEAVLDKVRTS